MGWYSQLQRDEVLAEWRKTKGVLSLHVHCHISGGNWLHYFIAKLRFFIFQKELPMVRISNSSSIINKEIVVFQLLHIICSWDSIVCHIYKNQLKDGYVGIFSSVRHYTGTLAIYQRLVEL